MRVYSLTVALIKIFAVALLIAQLQISIPNYLSLVTSFRSYEDSLFIIFSPVFIWYLFLALLYMSIFIVLWIKAHTIASKIAPIHEEDEMDGKFIIYDDTFEIIGMSLVGLYFLVQNIFDWIDMSTAFNSSIYTANIITGLILSGLLIFFPKSIQKFLDKFRAKDVYEDDLERNL